MASAIKVETNNSTTVHFANPSDREWCKHRYVFAFGAYGWTVVVVWANSLDDGLDEAIDWIADNAPGLLADDAVADAYNEAIANGMTEEAAQQEAEIDTTCGGNAGHYLHSWEWSIVAEDPTRAEMLAILGR